MTRKVGEALLPLIDLIPLANAKLLEGPDVYLSALEQAVSDFANALGFPFMRFSVRQRPALWGPEGIFFSTYPEAWDEQYIVDGYYLVDPLIRFIRDADHPEFLQCGVWSDYLNRAIASPLGNTESEREDYRNRIQGFFDMAAVYGLKDGFACQHVSDHCIVTICLSKPEKLSVDDDFFRLIRAGLILLADRATELLRLINRSSDEVDASPSLTDDQVAILLYFFDNPEASKKDIALLKSCSTHTIDYHLREVRKKMNLKGLSGYKLATLAKSQHFI